MKTMFSKIVSVLLLLFICIANNTTAQNIFPATGSAGIGTNAPNASSLLEMVSTSKGLLIPRMTKTQRDAIALPATGLMIYQTNSTPGFYYYSGTAWTAISAKGANASLSNLAATTAVNVSLLPGTTNARDIGSSTFAWKDFYLSGGLYYNGIKMMQYKPGVNTFIGENAGNANASAFNTAIGSNVLSNNTTGNSNVAVGENSLVYNTTGSNNNASGYAALINNTEGSNNTAAGFSALYSNTTGGLNTANGKNALYYNTTGSYNTAIGVYALEDNNAAENTAVGAYALQANASGYQNTATGAYALNQNETGYQNTAVGMYSLAFNIDGYKNAAFGYHALYSNEKGRDNAAFGHNALVNNYAEFADGNSAFGSQSLYYNTSGAGNSAMGYGAMESNTSGGNNTSVGYGSFEYNTTGSENTALGVRALNDNTTGSKNTAIGEYANTNDIGNLTNATAIGYDAQVDASNKVRIGNTSVTSIGGQVGWTNFSDGRIKKDIKENVPGLAFIKALRPVTYHFDLAKESALMGIKDSSSYKEKYDIEKIAFTGFVSQDVDEAAKKMNYDFSGVDKTGKIMGLRYAEFVVPLAKAVQELSKMNDDKDEKINDLQKQINELKAMVLSGGKTVATENAKVTTLYFASLEQNTPNPFNQSTTINYTLPGKFSNAKIIVTDNSGKTVKQFTISYSGKGSVTVAAGTLANGVYHYALYVDGKMTDSKKMEIIK